MFKFLAKLSMPGASALAKLTNIKPQLVNDMIVAMSSDPERQRQFVSRINACKNNPQELVDYALVFFVYRTFLVNDHPQEVAWWEQHFLAAGINPILTIRELEMASVFLRSVGFDNSRLGEAVAFFRKHVSATASVYEPVCSVKELSEKKKKTNENFPI